MNMQRIFMIVLFFIYSMKAQAQTEVDTASLRIAVEKFMNASDSSDLDTIFKTYAPNFLNVRVVDDGTIIRLNKDQMISILSTMSGKVGPTRSTAIQHIEVIGNEGYVLLTRIKDLGNGWEPMFYSLVWKKEDGKWLFLREFVHQKSSPKK
ncbi:hypothetical protein BH10BAC1_BH10BAC1_13930 [soil metagenome]